MSVAKKAIKSVNGSDGKQYILFKSGFCPLSNYFPSPFYVNGVRYFTVQHYWKAEMARMFGDEDAVQAILKVPSPREADRVAEFIRNFDEGKWNEKALEVLSLGVKEKFKSCFGPKRFLLDTGKARLVYASQYDAELGTGVAYENEDGNADPACWVGKNALGDILMNVRDELNQK